MAPAPWHEAPDQDENLFVLVTGCNSGIGLSICERLIDEFLESRPPTAHLILIPTTRSIKKSAETIRTLRRYLHTAPASRSRRPSASADLHGSARRVHLLSVQLDLCDLPSVYAAARQLVHGSASSPVCDDGFGPESLQDVRIPRLDAVVCNAGIGGWTGLRWLNLFWSLLSTGIVQATTWPTFKGADPGYVVDPRTGRSPAPASSSASKGDGGGTTTPVVGGVFCANIFGHYLFAHELLPLLSRPAGEDGASSRPPPGRVVWVSSIDAAAANYSPDDFQAIKSRGPYESTKRMTDILALTSNLPSVRPTSAPYFQTPEPEGRRATRSTLAATVPPRFYLTQPGIVASTLFPVPFLLFHAYVAVLYLARLLGSPWHPVTAYGGAAAPAWLVLQPQEELDALGADRVKWGSGCSRGGASVLKKTEVEGWGWEGLPEDVAALARDDGPAAAAAGGILRKAVGRKWYARCATAESTAEFEAEGLAVWTEMERLRLQWEPVLRSEVVKANGNANGNGVKS